MSHRQRIIRALDRVGVPTAGGGCFAEVLRAKHWHELGISWVSILVRPEGVALDIANPLTGMSLHLYAADGDQAAPLADMLSAWADGIESAAVAKRRAEGTRHVRGGILEPEAAKKALIECLWAWEKE